MVEAPRRLHPGSILIGFIRSLPQTVVAIPVALKVAGDIGWAWILPIVAASALISGFIAWLRWRRFTYAVGDDALVIESGILGRNRRTIPMTRIQDVDIERKLLQRLFGLATVRLETGGAGKDEAVLDSVSRAEAERLRTLVRNPSAVASDPAGTEQPKHGARTIFAMSLGRVLLFGLFNFSLVWLALLYGGLSYVDNWLPFDLADPRAWIAAERRVAGTAAVTPLLVGVALVLFGVLGIVAGVGRTLFREFGFTLTEEDRRLRRVRGLTTRSEGVVALRRVQLALVETGWLRRLFGWCGLSLQTLGGSGDAGGRQVVAPFAKLEEIDAVLAETRLARPEPEMLARVSSGHVLRSAIKHVGAPTLVLLLVGLAFPPVWLGLLAMPVPLAAALLSRRFHRWRRGEGVLAIARGVTTQRLWLVPERNIQSVTIRRTWLQRRLGVASVSTDTAGAKGARPEISDIAVATAWTIARDLSASRAAARAA